MLAMRKRSGQNWLRIEELGPDPSEPFGDIILDAFAVQDVLSTHPSDDELMSYRPRLSPDVQLEQRSRVPDQAWATTSLKLQLNCGLPASLPIEGQVAGFLASLDGTSTLRELADHLSESVKAYPDQVRQQVCSVVRRLAERRFVQLLR